MVPKKRVPGADLDSPKTLGFLTTFPSCHPFVTGTVHRLTALCAMV
jgi:hypothetical protein